MGILRVAGHNPSQMNTSWALEDPTLSVERHASAKYRNP